MTKTPQRHSANMIFYLGKTSIYIANQVKFLKFSWFPRYSYFDGGSYFKLSFYWFKSLIELSRPKKDNKVYKKVAYKEINKTLKKELKKKNTKNKKKGKKI